MQSYNRCEHQQIYRSFVPDHVREWNELNNIIVNVTLRNDNDVVKWGLHKKGKSSLRSMGHQLSCEEKIHFVVIQRAYLVCFTFGVEEVAWFKFVCVLWGG
jgi:capsule polysaccharide export protein KpsC/LpsZ